MTITVPAIRGRLGNTTYYEAKMRVGELVTGISALEHIPEIWDSMSIDERLQRDLDRKRIRTELGPYIANQPDRFFGSLIVLVYDGEITFEPLDQFGAKIPMAYRSASKDMGFVTIDGGHQIALDGQHRLVALRDVLQGEIKGPVAATIGNDEVAVIFIEHENSEKTRRIFNKVNRYAKATGRGDNIITSEDDGYAILARALLDTKLGAPLSGTNHKGEDLVNWKSNTLSVSSAQFTTISAVYETVKMILAAEGVPKLNEAERPSKEQIDEWYAIVEHYWTAVLQGLEPYKEALADTKKLPVMRNEDQVFSLLFKPAGQIALFTALTSITSRHLLVLEEAIRRANKVDWRMKSAIWRDIIVRPSGPIDVRSEARDRAALLLTYLLAADKLTDKEIHEIKRVYNAARGNEDVNEETWESLPTPVVELESEFVTAS